MEKVTLSKELMLKMGLSEEEIEKRTRDGTMVVDGKYFDLGKTLLNLLNYESDEIDSESLGNIIGLSGRSVRELAQKGVLSKNLNGRYKLRGNLKSFVAYLRLSNDKSSDSKDEELKRKKTDNLIREIKLKRETEELHEAEEVRKFISAMLLSFKTSLISVPDKVETMTEIDRGTKAIIQNCINESLKELAEYES